jgi:hypothetical protein
VRGGVLQRAHHVRVAEVLLAEQDVAPDAVLVEALAPGEREAREQAVEGLTGP